MALWSEIFLFYISIGVQDLWFLQHWHQQSGGQPGDQIQEVWVWSDLHREVEYWQHPGHGDHHWRPGLNASSIAECCLIRCRWRIMLFITFSDCKGTEVDLWHNLLAKHRVNYSFFTEELQIWFEAPVCLSACVCSWVRGDQGRYVVSWRTVTQYCIEQFKCRHVTELVLFCCALI